MELLRVNSLSFGYKETPVIEDIDFTVENGQVVAILGVNGIGKSTLLKCINRVLKPDKGEIFIKEKPAPDFTNRELAQHLAYVAQEQHRARYTVFDFVLLGRKPYIKWETGEKDLQIVSDVLERLGLSDYNLRYINELSGGELQKVYLARALAQEPDILMLDEPTSNLDLRNQLSVINTLKSVVKERNISALVTMHDINLALNFADRFILIKDGRIFADGGREVITAENIEAVYGVPVEILDHKDRLVVIY